MTWQTFAEKAQGESHKKHGKPVQDSAGCYSGEGMCIAVIADGHGSDNCFRSEQGSAFAADCALEVIKNFVRGIRETEEEHASKGDAPLSEKELTDRLKSQLAPGIVRSWNMKVDKHYQDHPITEEEMGKFTVDQKYRDRYLEEALQIREGREPEPSGGLAGSLSGPASRHAYGSTLIAAAITGDFWFGIHIGDGKLTAFYSDGTYNQPVPWDERCNLNITTSICDDDAAASARVYAQRKGEKPLPIALFVNSDGVDDSFVLDGNMTRMVKGFYFPVIRMFLENGAGGWDASLRELRDYLPTMSKNGSGDDMSVAGIIDLETAAVLAFTAALDQWKKEKEEVKTAKAAAEQMAREAAEQAAKKTSARQAAAAGPAEQQTSVGKSTPNCPAAVQKPAAEIPHSPKSIVSQKDIEQGLKDPKFREMVYQCKQGNEGTARLTAYIDGMKAGTENAEGDIPLSETKKEPPLPNGTTVDIEV